VSLVEQEAPARGVGQRDVVEARHQWEDRLERTPVRVQSVRSISGSPWPNPSEETIARNSISRTKESASGSIPTAPDPRLGPLRMASRCSSYSASVAVAFRRRIEQQDPGHVVAAEMAVFKRRYEDTFANSGPREWPPMNTVAARLCSGTWAMRFLRSVELQIQAHFARSSR